MHHDRAAAHNHSLPLLALGGCLIVAGICGLAACQSATTISPGTASATRHTVQPTHRRTVEIHAPPVVEIPKATVTP